MNQGRYMNAIPRYCARSQAGLVGQAGAGFTLVELLVLVAVFGVGALMLSPVLAGTRLNTKAVTCMYNMKQLTAGWMMYAGDNNDNLAINSDRSVDWNGAHSWVSGWLDWTSTSRDNTNALRLTDDRFSSLGSYTARAAKIFWCPTDTCLTPSQRAAGWTNRVRSVSMNGAIGNGDKAIDFPWLAFVAKKMGDLQSPGPRKSWLFMDEHPDSIDDGILYTNPGATNGIGEFIAMPSSSHGSRCGMGYADGHAEIHKWKDSRTVRGITFATVQRIPISSYSSDLAYIAACTPRAK